MGNFNAELDKSNLAQQTFTQYANLLGANGSLRERAVEKLKQFAVDKNNNNSNDDEVSEVIKAITDTFSAKGDLQITYANFDSLAQNYSPTAESRETIKQRLGIRERATGNLLQKSVQAEAAFYLLNTDDSGNLQELKAQADTQIPTNNPPELTTNQTNSTALDATNKTLPITNQLLAVTDDTSDATKLTYKLGVITGGRVYKLNEQGQKVEVKQGEEAFTQEDIQNNKISFEWDTQTENNVGFAFEVADETGGKTNNNYVVSVSKATSPAQNNTPPTNTKPTVKVTSNTKPLSTTGNTLALNKSMLQASDKETTDPAQLQYNLKGITGGTLKKEGQELQSNAIFTQADIDNNKISFEWDKKATTNVGFTFQLSDQNAQDPQTTQDITFAVKVTGAKKTKLTEGLPQVQGKPVKITGLDDKQARHIIQASLKSPGIGVGENYPLYEEDFQSSIGSNNNDVSMLVAKFNTASGNIISEYSGSKSEIAQVQLWLDSNKSKFNYSETIVQDGIYGPATVRAVKAFQTWYWNNRNPDYAPEKMFMDGIVGPYTQRAMHEVSAKYANFRTPDQETKNRLKV